MSLFQKKSAKPMKDAEAPEGKSLAVAYGVQRKNKKKAPSADKPRRIHPADMMSDDERATSIADAILEKRHKMAQGGAVDIEDNAKEADADAFDDLNEDAGEKELYDDEQLSAQPTDSNEKGDDIDSDAHDMISKIQAKLRAKRA